MAAQASLLLLFLFRSSVILFLSSSPLHPHWERGSEGERHTHTHTQPFTRWCTTGSAFKLTSAFLYRSPLVLRWSSTREQVGGTLHPQLQAPTWSLITDQHVVEKKIQDGFSQMDYILSYICFCAFCALGVARNYQAFFFFFYKCTHASTPSDLTNESSESNEYIRYASLKDQVLINSTLSMREY